MLHGDGQEALAKNEVEQANATVENRRLDDVMPGNSQNVSHQHVFEVLRLACSLAHGDDGRGRSHRIGDTDERLQRNTLVPGTHKRKDQRTDKGKTQTHPVSAVAMGVQSHQDGNGGAQRGDLGQRQINEDDAAFHHVNSEVRMDAGQDQTGDERQNQKRKYFHFLIWSPRKLWSALQYRNQRA